MTLKPLAPLTRLLLPLIKANIVLLVVALAVGGDLSAVEVTNVLVAGKSVTVCQVDLTHDRLELFLNDDTGKPLGSFDAVNRSVQSRGRKLVFGMNAGMYHRDQTPVGLLVIGSQSRAALNTTNGPGNFYMKPNGVFLVSDKGARVVETSEYTGLGETVLLATQSGPLLVRNGRIHPSFSENSTSRLIRNGVGVASSNRVFLAISDVPVNFHEFAVLFRDGLKCPDALYLDGVISSLHLEARRRSDHKWELGPILGVSE